MSKKTKLFCLILSLLIALCTLCACNDDDDNGLDYSKDHDFQVIVTDNTDALSFAPKDANYTYGLIFYKRDFISANDYSYLGQALAKQGFLVVIPKFELSAYTDYAPVEKAFADNPNVRFFVGGHSQGGGAAVRRSMENADKVIGTIVFAPYFIDRLLYDENGNMIRDENNVPVKIKDSIAGTNLPCLYVQAGDDNFLPQSIKDSTISRLSKVCTSANIEGGTHSAFSSAANDPLGDGNPITITAEDQRQATVQYTLAFMRSTVLNYI